MNNASSSPKVAVIGLGNIGKAIASNLVRGNHPVLIAAREEGKSAALAAELGSLATAVSIESAIAQADIVIPAIYFNVLKEFLSIHTAALDGKIIIDVTNPIAPDGNGGFKKIIGADESSGKILSGLIPKNAKLVKAFGTLGAAALSNDAFAAPERKVLFYASDSTNSNATIESLISKSGFAPLHVGGLEKSIRIEVFGDLHQYGALGKTVTLAEAKSKV